MNRPIRDDDAFWAKLLLHEKLPHCGCGDPAGVNMLVRDILQAIADDKRSDVWAELISPLEPVQQFVLLAVEDAGLIEHGSIYRVPWLLEDGKRLLAILNAVNVREWTEQDHQPATCPECAHVLVYEHQDCGCDWCAENWVFTL